MSTSDLCIYNRSQSYEDLKDFSALKTVVLPNLQIIDEFEVCVAKYFCQLHIIMYMHSNFIFVQITCHPQQDTDRDFSDGPESDDSAEMIAFEHSPSSDSTLTYSVNEMAEVFELY